MGSQCLALRDAWSLKKDGTGSDFGWLFSGENSGDGRDINGF